MDRDACLPEQAPHQGHGLPDRQRADCAHYQLGLDRAYGVSEIAIRTKVANLNCRELPVSVVRPDRWSDDTETLQVTDLLDGIAGHHRYPRHAQHARTLTDETIRKTLHEHFKFTLQP